MNTHSTANLFKSALTVLTKKMRDAERREEEAIKFAQNVQAESEADSSADGNLRSRVYE